MVTIGNIRRNTKSTRNIIKNITITITMTMMIDGIVSVRSESADSISIRPHCQSTPDKCKSQENQCGDEICRQE